MGSAVSAVAPVVTSVTGIIGNIADQGQRNSAEDAYNRALSRIQSTGAPPDLSKKILFEEFTKAGVLTPELEKEINLPPSEVAKIKEDQSLRDTQMNALQLLKQRASGGLGPEDRAALNEARNQMGTEEEAKKQQIIQNLQQRGQAGGGAEIAAQLANQQGGANRASAEGDRISSLASQRALEAIGASGQLGGQIRAQDFGVNQTKATAEDEMNRFNTQNQIARQERNVQAQNQAQAANLSNAQQLQNMNVATRNQELLRQNEAKRQQWLDANNQAKSEASIDEAIAKQRASQKAPSSALTAVGAGLGGLAQGISALGSGNSTGGFGSLLPSGSVASGGSLLPDTKKSLIDTGKFDLYDPTKMNG